MKMRPRDAALALASLSLDLIALSESSRAGLVAFSTSIVILGHYASLAVLARGLGRSGLGLVSLASALSFAALCALLLVVGLKAPALFPWAAAAACVAPLALSISAGIEGLLSMRRKAA
jgi:hypothetical protein